MRQPPCGQCIPAQQRIYACRASSDSEDVDGGQRTCEKCTNAPLGVGWPGERRIERKVRYWECGRECLEFGEASGETRGFVVRGRVCHGEGFDGQGFEGREVAFEKGL